jgi:hypothetical protein
MKLHDTFPDHPAIAGLGARAFRNYILSLALLERAQALDTCYLGRAQLRSIGVSASTIRKARWVDELVQANLWAPDRSGGVYVAVVAAKLHKTRSAWRKTEAA